MDEALEATDEAAKADAYGRLALSSSFLTLVYLKANAGEITGGGPTDPAALRLLRDAGWQPYSIRFGDTYYGYGRLDPLASAMGIVADVAEGMNGNPYTDDPEDEGIKALLTGASMAVFRNLSEKSYLSGIINLASAIENPEYYGSSFAMNLGSAAVPNLSAQVAGQLDPTMREMRSIVDKWKDRMPYIGDDLLPKRNFMGEELNRIQYAGGPLLGLLMPVPHSEVSNDIIKREVTKFGEVIGPPEALKHGVLDLREYKRGGQTAYDRYQELQGTVKVRNKTMRQSLEGLILSRQYGQMPDFSEDGSSSPKMEELRKTVSKYRKTAWNTLLREFPDLKENYRITRYNRSARQLGRAEKSLIGLID